MAAIQFVYEQDSTKAAAMLARKLIRELTMGKQVVWLMGGGSSIPLSVKIAKTLPSDRYKQLTCLLTDERYGPLGHADSNWQQLAAAGAMLPGLNFPQVLQPGLNLADTCAHYAEKVEEVFQPADIIIAQFGLGADGHIAGMLPQSPAITNDQLVVGYAAGNFQRITMTPKLMHPIDVAYMYVYGNPDKRPALQQLFEKQLPMETQPAQFLRTLPESYVFTDMQLRVTPPNPGGF